MPWVHWSVAMSYTQVARGTRQLGDAIVLSGNSTQDSSPLGLPSGRGFIDVQVSVAGSRRAMYGPSIDPSRKVPLGNKAQGASPIWVHGSPVAFFFGGSKAVQVLATGS